MFYGCVKYSAYAHAREAHPDGSHHYHVAVKLRVNQRFSAAKRTLVSRHGLPSHWSADHTQWCSAVRYCVYTSPKKTVVDRDRLVWAAVGHNFDPFEDAQESFNAKAWTKRRQQAAAEAPAQGAKEHFTKLDFNALVAEKNLTSKNEYSRTCRAMGLLPCKPSARSTSANCQSFWKTPASGRPRMQPPRLK